jgi:two-component system nitrate/nitrite response regulator NarL
MTRLLFLPNDQTFILLESPHSVDELMEAVQMGRWSPPEPYAARKVAPDDPVWCAFQHGNLVIITSQVSRENEQKALSSVSEEETQEPSLSPRQLEVLLAIANGLTTKEIALQLGLRPRTVNEHVSAIKERLGTATRAESVGYAVALGLFKPGSVSGSSLEA